MLLILIGKLTWPGGGTFVILTSWNGTLKEDHGSLCPISESCSGDRCCNSVLDSTDEPVGGVLVENFDIVPVDGVLSMLGVLYYIFIHIFIKRKKNILSLPFLETPCSLL